MEWITMNRLLIRFLLPIVLIQADVALAIEKPCDSLRNTQNNSNFQPMTSLFIELGGKFMPSLNLDFRKKENFAFSIGSSFWYDTEEHAQTLFIPNFMAYYLSGKRHRLELGGGAGPLIGTYAGLTSALIFANIGYRLQKKNGFFFRIGFTPFMGIPLNKNSRFIAMPWAGLSLGYSF